MLNKLLQKSRNSKFDGGAAINSSRQAVSQQQQQQQQQQLSSPSFPLNTCSFSSKLSNDSQKTSLIGSTNSASLVASSFASQPSQTSLKPAQNQSTINAKSINNQPLISNNYNFSSSSSSENYIFSSSSAARAITPTSSSSSTIPFSGSQRIQTSAPVGMNLQQHATLPGAKNLCNNNSNLTSPDTLKTSPMQSMNLHTPQPTKLKQFDQPIYSAQRVAVNLNSKIDFINSQCTSSDAITAIRQSSDASFKKPNPSTESEYQAKIKGLETKIALLVSELEKQTTLSNSALQDNTIFKQKYQVLQNSTSKQQPLQQQSSLLTSSFPKKRSDSSCIQYELDAVQAIDIQAENVKLKAQIAGSTQEAQSWRQKYELLDKQFESHDEALKSKLSEQFEKEIAALNQELSKYKSNISGNNNKLKKPTTSGIRTSGGTSAASSNAFKENTNAMSNSTNMSTSQSNFNNQQSNLSEDWHANYCALKEEKDKTERNLKKKIESLEEQNAFLQNESQQTQQSNNILQSSRACSQQGMQSRGADATTSNIKELNMYFSKNLEFN